MQMDELKQFFAKNLCDIKQYKIMAITPTFITANYIDGRSGAERSQRLEQDSITADLAVGQNIFLHIEDYPFKPTVKVLNKGSTFEEVIESLNDEQIKLEILKIKNRISTLSKRNHQLQVHNGQLQNTLKSIEQTLQQHDQKLNPVIEPAALSMQLHFTHRAISDAKITQKLPKYIIPRVDSMTGFTKDCQQYLDLRATTMNKSKLIFAENFCDIQQFLITAVTKTHVMAKYTDRFDGQEKTCGIIVNEFTDALTEGQEIYLHVNNDIHPMYKVAFNLGETFEDIVETMSDQLFEMECLRSKGKFLALANENLKLQLELAELKMIADFIGLSIKDEMQTDIQTQDGVSLANILQAAMNESDETWLDQLNEVIMNSDQAQALVSTEKKNAFTNICKEFIRIFNSQLATASFDVTPYKDAMRIAEQYVSKHSQKFS